MTAQETERLTIVEQKLDQNGKDIKTIKNKANKTHDAVLQLPKELEKTFVTRLEFAAAKWVASLIALVLGILSFKP